MPFFLMCGFSGAHTNKRFKRNRRPFSHLMADVIHI
jgi:hypothetical protein